MGTDVRQRDDHNLDLLLKGAHAALDRGDVRAGREASQKVLKGAEATGEASGPRLVGVDVDAA